MKKINAVIASLMLLLMLLPTVVCASTPYSTYTYSIDGEVLESPAAYVPDAVIDSEYIGQLDEEDKLVSLGEIRDIFIDPDENIFLVDATNNRIVILDKYFKFKAELAEFVNEHGVPQTFNSPSGVFVSDELIYVCDTNNNRIVIFEREDEEGNIAYHKTVLAPKSELFGDTDVYLPVAVAVDAYGRLFVVSQATYQGIVVMSDDGSFYGFIGAQKVSKTAIEAIWSYFQTAEDRENAEKNVSTEYNNITIDKDNFLYVTTSSIDKQAQQNAIESKDMSADYAPVKKLNSTGADVMSRTGFYPPSGEVKVKKAESSEEGPSASVIVDVAIGPNDTWSIIDQQRSRVFTYDSYGNLLFAFGDTGVQTGNINRLSGIAYQGDNILALDVGSNSIVVFRRTEYGDILMKALVNQSERQYDKATQDWEEIRKRNNNFDLAYVGIGQAYFRSGDYEQAMEYYKAAHDTAKYSESFAEQRKDWANKFFWIIPIIILAVIVLIAMFFGYAARENKRASIRPGKKSLKEELLYICHLIVHPFDGFWDLKHEYRGSLRAGFIILFATVIAFYYQSIGTGYIFNSKGTTGTIFTAALSVIVPLMLWVVANWGLTTLFEGEGSFKDVFVASTYAIAPLPVLIIVSTVLSNFLVTSEGSIITIFTSLAFGWAGILLYLGSMVTHGFTMFKNFVMTLATIVGMLFLMFMALLFSSLIGRIISFIASIIVEINYRL